MATIITAEPLIWGSRLERASINGHQFIEPDPLRWGFRLPDPTIGSSHDIHSVLNWTPDHSSEGHPVGGPVTVNFKAENSEPLAVEFVSGTDFENGGTHDGTEVFGDAVQLLDAVKIFDFEDYVVDTTLTSGGQPESWISRTQWNNRHLIRDKPTPDTNRVVHVEGDREGISTLVSAGDVESGLLEMMVYWPSAFLPTRTGLGFCMTGSGTALRGHAMTFKVGDYRVWAYRIDDEDSWYAYASITVPTPQINTWYHFKVHFWTTTTVNYEFKLWKDSDTEPTEYTWGWASGSYVQPGAVGILTDGTGQSVSLDNFAFDSGIPEYPASGEWTSDPIDVSSVETFSSGILTFDKTEPTDTTAALRARWNSSGEWQVCTSGETVPGIEYRDDMTPGSIRQTLEFRIELATTDAEETPSVSNIQLNFDPCDFANAEIDVDGKSATMANEHLAKWGKEQVSGGTELIAYDDLFVRAHTLKSYRLHGEEIEAKFIFSDYEIDSIIFSQLVHAIRIATGGDAYFGFSGQAGAVEANSVASWTARMGWWKALHSYEWVLIDKTQRIRADARYRIGHPRNDDFLGSIVVAVAEQADFPGTILAKAYQRDDFPGTQLVQGWRIDDLPGSILAALQSSNDFPGSVIVGIGRQDDFPGGLLVFGVNRKNVIEIHTIDSDTLAELQLIGFVFPPEV